MLRPRHPAAVRVERGFRRLRHGDVHYRAAGAGPVLLALHESPRSSLSMLPVLAALADSHRVVAPDTAGYGLSDPLPDPAPSLEAFTDVIADFLDSLGVERTALYGAHTGASLAVAFAGRYPQRVTSLTLDGLSVFDAVEVEDFRTRYLIPYAARWDGGHVMVLWSRVKDLFTWFPWHDQSPERRLAFEAPSLEALQRTALGFVQAGAHYTKAYTHAAAFDPNSALRSLQVPVTIFARPDDLIADHLARLDPTCGATIRMLGPAPSEWIAALSQAVAKGATPGQAAPGPDAETGSRFVPVGDGWLHVHLAGPSDGPVRMLLPGLPGDLAALVAQQSRLHPDERLLGVSPPGCGWSDPLAAESGLKPVIESLDQAVRALGLSVQAITAQGASAVLARLWDEIGGGGLPIELVDPPAWLSQANGPTGGPLLDRLQPRWDGAHLTGAWFQLRDLALYDVPPSAGAPLRREPPSLDVEALDRLFRSYVEGPECADLLAEIRAYALAEPPQMLARSTHEAPAGTR